MTLHNAYLRLFYNVKKFCRKKYFLAMILATTFLLSITVRIFAGDGTSVTLTDGTVEGFHKTSFDGRKFLSFEGIPFAQPPVEDLRLRPPRPVQRWYGTLYGNITHTCPQFSNGEIIGNEDCLYLNVYVAREVVYKEANLPVLVHFHGGSFMTGSPQAMAGPSKLMDREIVYVTVNYRLGILGFLSIGDEIISGNFGLKDQSLALAWIRANIDKFGGDIHSVTITGASAGGASVHLHYFSPLSRDLFHRGFVQSGTAFNPWIKKRNPETLTNGFLRRIQCNKKVSERVLHCLQSKTANTIMELFRDFVDDKFLPLVPFGPVVEVQHPGAFLSADPYDLLTSGNFNEAPLLISVTTEEVILPTALFFKDLDNLNHNWTSHAPKLMEYYTLDEDEQFKISARILDVFFENKMIGNDNFQKLVKLIAKRLFDLSAEKSAFLHSSTLSNVYLMKFAYGGDEMVWNRLFNISLNLGVAHGEEARFFYDTQYQSPQLTDNEKKLKDTLLDMVVNFAKYGEAKLPNVKWEGIRDVKPIEYLVVKGPEEFVTEKSDNKRYEEFWNYVDEIINREYVFNDEL